MKPCPRTLLERDYTRKNELLHEQLRKEVANQNTDEFKGGELALTLLGCDDVGERR